MAYNWPAIGFNVNADTGNYMTTNYGSEIIENYTAGYLEISSYASGTAGSGLGSGSQLVLSSNGNIGIDATSPAATLQIGSLATTGTNGYGLYVSAPTGATNNYGAVFATGNVGIGDDAWATRLKLIMEPMMQRGARISR